MHTPFHPLLLTAGILTGIWACQTPAAAPSRADALLRYFHPMAAADTLRFEIEDDNGPTPAGDTIPNALFFPAIDPALLAEIDYLADSTESVVSGKQRFPLNDSVDACLVFIDRAWFRHQSLLQYNKRRHAFTDRTTVAEFYGGDGGQVLTGSWVLDVDGDGQKDIIRRDIEHSMIPVADSAREVMHESALLLRWQGERFVEAPLSDTAWTIKHFPIRSMW